MPVCLFSRAENRYAMNVGAASEDKGGGKGSTETRKLRRREESVGSPGGMKESEGAMGGGGLRGGNRGLGSFVVGERWLGRMRAGC